jgi:hypothetical protein
MEEFMKIYYIEKSMDQGLQKTVSAGQVSGLKKAAGGEDMVILTPEALNSYRRENDARLREEELVRLALMHIDDRNTVLDELENDAEFIKAERRMLMAELVMRVAPSGRRRMTGNDSKHLRKVSFS